MENQRSYDNISISKLSLTTLQGSEFDLLPIYGYVHILETFDSIIDGFITLKDNVNFQSMLPIIGGEKISFSFYDKNTKTNVYFEFYVYDITTQVENKEDVKASEFTVMVHFYTFIGLKGLFPKFNKKFEGKPEDLLTGLFSIFKDVKPIVSEPTKNIVSFVPSYWNIFKIINYIKRKAVSDTDKYTYVFFETLTDYIFKTIDTICKEPSKHTFYYRRGIEKINPYIFRSYKIKNYFNATEMEEYGVNGHISYDYDILNDVYTKVRMSYKDANDKYFTNLGHYHLFNDEIISSVTNKPELRFDGSIMNYVLRKMRLNLIGKFYTMELTLGGSMDKKTGDIVSLEFPSLAIDKDQPYDNLWTSNYMIYSISHIFSSDSEYVQQVRLFKDSFLSTITTETQGDRNLIKFTPRKDQYDVNNQEPDARDDQEEDEDSDKSYLDTAENIPEGDLSYITNCNIRSEFKALSDYVQTWISIPSKKGAKESILACGGGRFYVETKKSSTTTKINNFVKKNYLVDAGKYVEKTSLCKSTYINKNLVSFLKQFYKDTGKKLKVNSLYRPLGGKVGGTYDKYDGKDKNGHWIGMCIDLPSTQNASMLGMSEAQFVSMMASTYGFTRPYLDSGGETWHYTRSSDIQKT